MTFKLMRATPADIPGMVAVWYSGFTSKLMLNSFPDTAECHAYMAKTMEYNMKNNEQVVYMIVVEEDDSSQKTDVGTKKERKVASFSQWYIHHGGDFPDWKTRWLQEGSEIDATREKLFRPAANQHAVTLEERPHYFLEIMATDANYRKQGHASKILEWGNQAADKEGWECYLDAAPTAKGYYNSHGYEVQEEKQHVEAVSLPMRRSAKKVI
ncbi:hypothetical protein B7494_g6208 [Chlorociboria aeruginascens]|nr:hypothetical protein B7494_g6208 [Chlorociboria aeruginascens]